MNMRHTLRLPIILSTLVPLALAACSDDRREERLKAAGPNPSLTQLMKVADAEVGERQFGQCLACHRVNPDSADQNGPNLYNAYGAQPGQNRPRYPYTAALIALGGTWNDETLDAWLQGPTKLVPGTKMQTAGIEDPLTRADIIAYLKTRRDAR